jgi:4-carboxymuconolactone decarboxylase
MDREKWEKGRAIAQELTGKEENIFAGMGPFSDLIMEFVFAEVYSREGITLKERQIATLAVQTALGLLPQLKIHMGIALNIGMTPREIEEILIQTAVYAGFPAAMNGYKALSEVVKEGNREG